MAHGEEVVELPAAPTPEADDESPAGAQRSEDVLKRGPATVDGEEPHHVACRDRNIDIADLDRIGGKVANYPSCFGEVLLRVPDQHRVDVDAEDDMSTLCQIAAKATSPAPCIEDAGVAGGEGVDKPGLPVDIFALLHEVAPPLGVILGVVRVCSDNFFPSGQAQNYSFGPLEVTSASVGMASTGISFGNA